MPTIYFMGYVEPRGMKFMLENLTPVMEKDKATGFVSTFTVAVLDSVLSVECEVDVYRSEYVSVLYTRALELARTATNLVSLKLGGGLQPHLDTFINPDGKEEITMYMSEKLKGIFNSFEMEEIDQVFALASSNVDLSMAVNDLISAVTIPRTGTIDCARAIDGIRYLLDPALEDKPGWKNLHAVLRVDMDYVMPILSGL